MAEIASLSMLSVLKFKSWCSSCVEHLITGRNEWDDAQLSILSTDKTFDDESLKAMLAALVFILEKAVKSACSSHDLELEMQQLGLPAEHCKQLTKVYAMNLKHLRRALLSNFPRSPYLAITSVDMKDGEGGKVFVMNLLTNTNENISVALNDTKLNYLLQELSQAMDVIRPYIRNASSE